MISAERQTADFREIKIPTYYGRGCGIQKSWIFRYVCLKCNYKEDLETPPQQAWTCKKCENEKNV